MLKVQLYNKSKYTCWGVQKSTKAVEDNLKEETEVLDITGEQNTEALLLEVKQMKM